MKHADKQHAKPSRHPSAALHPWHSSSGFRHPTDSSGRSVPLLAAAFPLAREALSLLSSRPPADEARGTITHKPTASVLGSVDALRFLRHLRASRLMPEMTRGSERRAPAHPSLATSKVEQRHLRPMKLADQRVKVHSASHRKHCIPGTLRAASGIPSRASEAACRF